MAKRIRIDGTLYEAVGPRIPKVSKSSFSDQKSWSDHGSDVGLHLITLMSGSDYKVWLEVKDDLTGGIYPMAEVSALYSPELGDASFSVDTTGPRRGRAYGFDRRNVSLDDFLRVVNDVVSEVASGVDLDDLDATRSFVRRRLTRTVTRRLEAADFERYDF